MMEDCPSSYCQNFFLDPKALHFVNLETSTPKSPKAVLFESLGKVPQKGIIAEKP